MMPGDDVRAGSADPPNLAAALYHAQAGRPVFPCSPKDKRPAIAKRDGGNGFKDATTDLALIRRWWSQYPEAVPGMPTGARVGVWVLDVDTKAGKVGEDTLAKLVQTFGELPETVETITATGGRHLFFRHPRDGRTIPNSASQLGLGHERWGRDGFPEVPFEILASGRLRVPDLDVRGDGGYVILPGSVMLDGRRYQWEGSSDPDEGAQVAQAPGWLLSLVAHDPAQERTTGAAPGATVASIGEGGRNDYLYRLGCSLRAKGLGEAAIIAALLAENAERCDPALPDEEVRTCARSAAARPPGLSPAYEARRQDARERPPPGKPDLRVVGGTEHDDRPELQIIAGKLPVLVDRIEEALLAQGADIYQHGTRLVRVGAWEAPTAEGAPLRRPSGAGVLCDITAEWLVDRCTRRIRFTRYDKRADDWRDTDCPTKAASTLLARVGEWRFPTLTGFCDAPTLDLSGRLIEAPGYDVRSGLYLSHPPRLPAMGVMSLAAAQGAGSTLYEAIETFPFVTTADAAAALAGILTALLRRLLPSAPILGVSASTPGTGKSKLIAVIASIASGRPPAVVAIGSTPEELEKRLDAVLLKGDALVSFDNVDRPIKSDVLCQVATEATKGVRVLGESKNVEAPTNVTLCATGNNLVLVGDLIRRTMLCNLDAGCERPELRVFDRDAVGHVLEQRPSLIAAALTIAKSYIDAGCPEVDARPFGSFEAWDRMVRRPLIWAGWPDPLTPAESLREQDHELSGMRDLLIAWQEAQPEPCTAAELSALIRSQVPRFGEGYDAQWPALRDAAVTVMGDLPRWGPRELGYRLRAMAGRLFAGRRVVKAGTASHNKGVLWRVEGGGS